MCKTSVLAEEIWPFINKMNYFTCHSQKLSSHQFNFARAKIHCYELTRLAWSRRVMICCSGIQLSMKLVRGLKSLARVFVKGAKVSQEHSTVIYNKVAIITSTQM